MNRDAEQSLCTVGFNGYGEQRPGVKRSAEQTHPSAVLLGEEEYSISRRWKGKARRILCKRRTREGIHAVRLRFSNPGNARYEEEDENRE